MAGLKINICFWYVDNAIVEEMIDILRGGNYDPEYCIFRDIAEVKELILSGVTNLIISDFDMPGMNGQEVVNTLRKMDYNVKVMLSSGGLGTVEEEEVAIRGFNGFLKKPYSMSTLSDKIAEILN